MAGLRQSLALVLVGLAGLALTAAAVWWALTHKGLVRGLAVALAVASPLTVLILYRSAQLTWVVLLALALLAWPSRPAGPPCAATPSPRSCTSTTPSRPGGHF